MAATGLITPAIISPMKYNFKNELSGRSKSRIILHSTCDYTDVHPLNLGQINRHTNLIPTPLFSKISPEKLIERSQQLRLSRLSNSSNLPPISTLDNTSCIQSTKPQQKTSVPIIARHQSLPKVKPSPVDISQRTKSRMSNPVIARHVSCRQTTIQKQSNDNGENLPWIIDEEFRQYLQRATLKCADWLMRNNFEEKEGIIFV